ncbi:prepilin peptidase [Gordonia sp. NPDC062954]|uniref:Prepilin peptidase n=1 Tax=Gordonia aquimaris TaxID=2984863 RepID=A0A9X3D5F5_9ACTN|nr:prepilin peptidase [Gordonia aquimaris]MCX2965087.1 prepilin peptidase [Gordonia aquimaris]
MATVLVLCWLATIAERDRRTGRIPVALMWPGLVIPVTLIPTDPTVAAAATLAAVPYLIAALVGHGGGGDIKLAFAIGGLVADPTLALLVVLLAATLGGLDHLWVRSGGPRPHAPALVAAAVIGLGLG